MKENYLSSLIGQFEYYKMLGEKAMLQLNEEKLFWRYNDQSNSIAIIVNHLSGNMRSRFTDFLSSDGEKPWRDRDSEFENVLHNRAEVVECWELGWAQLMATLKQLDTSCLENVVYIRGEAHTVIEALNRQLAHYPYHIGQIVMIAKMASDGCWESLSIPLKGSKAFNEKMYGQKII